jgi:hypothetical protein
VRACVPASPGRRGRVAKEECVLQEWCLAVARSKQSALRNRDLSLERESGEKRSVGGGGGGRHGAKGEAVVHNAQSAKQKKKEIPQ